MGYSLNRAVPLAVIGFVAGAGFVILLRMLQSMDEVWHPQLGLVIGGLFAAVFFLWGIGALSPSMAGHHVQEPEEDEFGNELPVEDHHHVVETPASILSDQIWTIAFWTMILFIGLLFFAALPGGFGYTVSSDAAANANTNGFFPIDTGNGNTLYVSKLVAFIVFAAITMASLFGAAWLIARGFFSLNRGIKEAKAEGNRPLEPLFQPLGAGSAVAALTSGEGAPQIAAAVIQPPAAKPSAPMRQYSGFSEWAPAALFGSIGWIFGKLGQLVRFHLNMIFDEPTPAHKHTTAERLKSLVLFVVVIAILHVLFYEVLVGLVLPQPYWLRIVASFGSAVMVTLLIFRTKWVLFIIGRVARFSAWILRALPEFLFQRD
ncbi:MAG: hypothetical protein IPK52_04550 [Chloroflexi bacterium]|nr:hypothetical protein [Chloroflexota bacterium]